MCQLALGEAGSVTVVQVLGLGRAEIVGEDVEDERDVDQPRRKYAMSVFDQLQAAYEAEHASISS